jgi:hypothetical protein
MRRPCPPDADRGRIHLTPLRAARYPGIEADILADLPKLRPDDIRARRAFSAEPRARIGIPAASRERTPCIGFDTHEFPS